MDTGHSMMIEMRHLLCFRINPTGASSVARRGRLSPRLLSILIRGLSWCLTGLIVSVVQSNRQATGTISLPELGTSAGKVKRGE
jgi:hypothetical protein